MHQAPAPSRNAPRRLFALTPLAAAALALSAPSFAQTDGGGGAAGGSNQGSSPFYVGASQAFSRDSNIFRVPKGSNESSDTVSTTSLLAGIDQPFGRQRVRANAAVRHNKYQDLDQLDHTGYQLGLGLDWETIEKLSGTLSLVATENLARYGAEDAPTTTQRNIERAQQFGATIQYGGQSVLTLYGLVDHRRVDYSLSLFDPYEYKRDQLGVGLRYRVSGALLLGVEARAAKGEYPRFRQPVPGTFVADEFDRQDLSLTALWQPTGASRINARVGVARQSHDVEARDFEGVTGSLLWDWRPTGKLRFETQLLRDTGNESEPLRLAGVVDAVGDNSEVSNRVQLRAFYDATAKIQLDALLRYTRRSLVDTVTLPLISISNAGHDATTVLGFGARWNPTRTIQLGCSVGREDRNADSTVSYDYKVNTASCFAQLLLNP